MATGPAAAGAPAPAGDLVVRTHGLTKTYGRRTVVDHLDLAVPRAAVYGFLGPNGSGKSTTMKMLLGLAAPTSGSVELLGRPLTRSTRGALMAATGSLIEQPPGYGHLTGAENMRIVQRMCGLSDSQVTRALALVRLTKHADRLQRSYSLGMKQRLGIAMALAREPELLILDEPTNGLDPAGIEEVRELLVRLAGEGVSVMVSSHLLDEIDRMAGVLGILDSGRLVFQGTRAQLMERSVPDLRIVLPGPEQARTAAACLSGTRWGRRGAGSPGAGGAARAAELVVPDVPADDAPALVRYLVEQGLPLCEVRRVDQSLEDLFMDLTGRGGAL